MSKYKGDYLLIWHIVVWFIWKTRNDVIFKKIIKIVKEVEEKSAFYVPRNNVWVDPEGTLALSLNDFTILFSTCIYSRSNVCLDLKIEFGYWFLLWSFYRIWFVDDLRSNSLSSRKILLVALDYIWRDLLVNSVGWFIFVFVFSFVVHFLSCCLQTLLVFYGFLY